MKTGGMNNYNFTLTEATIALTVYFGFLFGLSELFVYLRGLL
jgi:hypothetical protein